MDEVGGKVNIQVEGGKWGGVRMGSRMRDWTGKAYKVLAFCERMSLNEAR